MSNKIILNLAISLDGFIADVDGGYAWIQPSGNSGLNTAARWKHEEFLHQISAVVMGKRCYDQQFHKDYDNQQVYVITSQKLNDYENIHFICTDSDVCGEIKALKETVKGDIYLFGGGVSVDPMIKAEMIDEYIIGIIPIILGSGRALFLQNNPIIPLHLTHYYIEDGIVVLRYIPRN